MHRSIYRSLYIYLSIYLSISLSLYIYLYTRIYMCICFCSYSYLKEASASLRLVHSHHPQMHKRRQKLRVEASKAANESRQ